MHKVYPTEFFIDLTGGKWKEVLTAGWKYSPQKRIEMKDIIIKEDKK